MNVARIVIAALIVGFTAIAVDAFIISPLINSLVPLSERWYVYYTVDILAWLVIIAVLWKPAFRLLFPTYNRMRRII